MKPQTLNIKQAKAKALAAYHAGTLTAQNGAGCLYVATERNGKPCNCAIGAGMSPATLKLVQEKNMNGGCGVANLIRQGVLATDDKCGLVELQCRHDNWANAARTAAAMVEKGASYYRVAALYAAEVAFLKFVTAP